MKYLSFFASSLSALSTLSAGVLVAGAALLVGCEDQAFCFDCGAAGQSGAAGTSSGGSGGASVCTGCTASQTCCLGACVDVTSDATNCGACGTICPLSPTGQGVASCVAGQCTQTASCALSSADCDKNGSCETELASDRNNCGACGKVCPSTTASPGFCENGICKSLSCGPGTSDCNGSPADGCETKIDNSLDNCGGCNTPCPTGPVENGQHACSGGACVLACNTGFGDCDGDAANGCETDLTRSATNCGSCGGECGAINHGTPSCVAGACVASCDPLFGDCNGDYADGCELDLSSDANNCSACGAKCPLDPNGNAPVCANGSCSAGTCQLGFDDCKATIAGCETNVATDPNNCGLCGLVCPAVPNGTSTCDFFECVVKPGSCTAPFADCFGGITDGCETNLDESVEHCGACGARCPDADTGTIACVAGQCEIVACAPGYADCDLVPDNGCEAKLATDKLNCNGCGLLCSDPLNGAAVCEAGQCKLAACGKGFDSCDGVLANGCETPVDTDPNNCGACDFVCPSGACTDGKCVAKTSFLILRDTAAVANDEVAKLATFLASETGFTIDVSPSRFFQYDGTNPAPTPYGGILLLAGSPDGTGSYQSDMPAAGQQAIVDFVKAGNGLVLTEWAAHYVEQGKWQTLAEFVLLERTIAFSGQVDYQIEPAFATHPIWAGFTQPSFVVNSASNLGVTRLGPGIKRVASSQAVLDPVAILELPNVGRVVHLAHSGNYSPFGWSNPNIRKLLANSVRWTTRQQ